MLAVRERRTLVAPVAATKQLLQLAAILVVEQEEVHLVGVLVLDDAPRESARVEEVAVQPDLAGDGFGRRVVADRDGDLGRNQAPVERAGLQGFHHLLLLKGCSALENVVAAGCESRRGAAEKHCGYPHGQQVPAAERHACRVRLAADRGVTRS